MLLSPEKKYAVSDLNREARLFLEGHFSLIWVEGELSNYKRYPSGHMYFSLKDAQAQVRCVMFASRNQRLNFTPKEGSQVLLRAKVTLYEERGDFQLTVEAMEETGDGALKRAFDALKKKLAEEGLFDQRHKKPLPVLPRCIGLITSSKGAAVHDILTTLYRRFPAIPIIIYPAQVQGESAPQQIAAQIVRANQRQDCDVLIVGRGGGSLEDLQAFNTEQVARAVFASLIPIISAVGHEVDVTITDFVADVRAPTPTAAAELVSPDQEHILAGIHHLKTRLIRQVNHVLMGNMQALDHLSKRLRHPSEALLTYRLRLKQLSTHLAYRIKQQYMNHLHAFEQTHMRFHQHDPHTLLQQYRITLSECMEQLTLGIQRGLADNKQRLAYLSGHLHQLSPLETLSRGYAIVSHQETLIHSVTQVSLHEALQIQMIDGLISTSVTAIKKTPFCDELIDEQ